MQVLTKEPKHKKKPNWIRVKLPVGKNYKSKWSPEGSECQTV